MLISVKYIGTQITQMNMMNTDKNKKYLKSLQIINISIINSTEHRLTRLRIKLGMGFKRKDLF
jgi:hypothetical protein